MIIGVSETEKLALSNRTILIYACPNTSLKNISRLEGDFAVIALY